MEKDNLRMYVDLMNKYDEQAQMGITMVFNNDEKNLMKYMRQLAIQNKEAKKFLNELTNMTPIEREQAVENYFGGNKKSTGMITLDNIKDYKEQIDELSKENKNKLNYLINHYNTLKIKGIIISEMKYIDSNDEVRELVYDNYSNQYRVKGLYEEEKEETNQPIERLTRELYRSNSEEYNLNVEDEPKKELEKYTAPNKQMRVPEKKAGFISACLLFVLTGFTGGILATILTLVLSR